MRAHATTQPAAAGDSAEAGRRQLLERFVEDLGYPAAVVGDVISRFRRERGAMTASDAGHRLAEWIGEVRRAAEGRTAIVPVADAVEAFVLSGAAMWHVDALFAEPSALPATHRAALTRHRSSVVPIEHPLPMQPQNLDGPRWGRRSRPEPTVRRLSWVPSR
ncbi:hypothetical protein [Labedella endophytica]|uniref:Uncharacterized protein n=1 Tax=Labedella endophytica TaxID=1523160 RepID=A0A433JQ77_9MICO|nr:hypothetical protein [Labedella endophytica]RUQ98914.1 hypothetical protein ELQ94_11290 [Labedella endophytica]